MYNSYVYEDNSGNIKNEEPQENPNYLGENKRKIYEFLYDFLPTSQAMQLSNMSAHNPDKISFFSLIIAVASTSAGLAFFYKKDPR